MRLLLKYDIEFFFRSDFAKIDKKRARLKIEVFKILKIINTATAKLTRLFKQQNFLISRKAEIIRRNLKNVDKLEKLETQKKIEKIIIINNTGLSLSFDFFLLEFFEILIFFFFEGLDRTAAVISNNF